MIIVTLASTQSTRRRSGATAIDDHKHDYAELTSSIGKTTNASGAGILNGGITFSW